MSGGNAAREAWGRASRVVPREHRLRLSTSNGRGEGRWSARAPWRRRHSPCCLTCEKAVTATSCSGNVAVLDFSVPQCLSRLRTRGATVAGSVRSECAPCQEEPLLGCEEERVVTASSLPAGSSPGPGLGTPPPAPLRPHFCPAALISECWGQTHDLLLGIVGFILPVEEEGRDGEKERS